MKFMNDKVFVIILIALFLPGCTAMTVIKKTDPAILRLKEAVNQNPADPQKRLELANIYLEKFVTSKQRLHLYGAFEETREAIRLKPDIGRAHLLLSRLLWYKALIQPNEQTIEECKKEYEEALRLNPELAATGEYDPPYILAGTFYLALSEYNNDERMIERAFKDVKNAIRLKPNSAVARSLLGEIYYKQGEYRLALLEFKKAASLAPDNPGIHKSLGKIYAAEGTHNEGDSCRDDKAIEQAIKEYKQAIRLDPKDDEAHRNLASLYKIKGLDDLEIYESKEALRINKSAENHRALGIAYLDRAHYWQALDEFRKAIQLKPDFILPRLDIAITYYLQNKFEKAVKAFKKSYKLYPTYITLLQDYSLRKLGKDAEARELLENYARDFKGEAWNSHLLNYHLGKLTESELISKAGNMCDRNVAFFLIGSQYLLKGDNEKAKEFFQKVIDTKLFSSYEYTAARARLMQIGPK